MAQVEQRLGFRNHWRFTHVQAAQRLVHDRIVYRGSTMKPGDIEHLALVKRALCAKFAAHPEIARAFVATAPRPIEHDTGHPGRPGAEFPRETFCRLLSELRDELAAGSTIDCGEAEDDGTTPAGEKSGSSGSCVPGKN
ncbi:MAG TPA: hypothetical protein VGL71_04710 [Urbifossiella sp.]|jgi:hypothetical protein